ncbi:MAG: helix-turn-helix transcriptional regulator, partial [Solirubrobacterales bacterium]|nr:helix-turn-helix transcriptional regulator [Solirubrobacterales bacterium]
MNARTIRLPMRDAAEPPEPMRDAPEPPEPTRGAPGPPEPAFEEPEPDRVTSTTLGLEDPSRAALADALAAVGDRWTLLLVAALLDGPRRFGELQEEVQGIAPNVLSQRLRQLERNALIVARAYSERPPRFVYELSSAGHELAGALRLLAGWGARNAEGASA